MNEMDIHLEEANSAKDREVSVLQLLFVNSLLVFVKVVAVFY